MNIVSKSVYNSSHVFVSWFLSTAVVTEDGIVRFYTDRFGGPMMMHCHVLEHEDKGSMGLAYVQGVREVIILVFYQLLNC